ncbi:MAG: hypothetical protein ABJF04_04025 [Reichenbachiella sp.]|uniref:hypothetical protein n=1 Tax=Reichenbachiella sp. TaxID=2184521 RepID=UPI003266AFB7
MKQLGLIILAICTINLASGASDPVKEDTVVIEFGERSKMVIYAETQQDLKDLGEYDINAMIGELNANLDSTSTTTEEVSIEDESGTKYLKESTESEEGNTGSLSYYGDERYRDEDDDRYERRIKRYEDVRRDIRRDIDRDVDVDFDDDDYIVIKRGRSRGRGTYGSFEVELGMNNWLEDGSFPDQDNAAYAVKPWGSWYVGLGGVYHTSIAGPLKLKWGGNMTWYNWKMEDPTVRIAKTDVATTFVPDPTIDGKKSKLAATYVNAMVVPMLEFNQRRGSRHGRGFNWSKYRQRGFRIGAGMYAGYRIDSWTKMKYSINGDKQKDKEKGNYYLNNFRYGIRGQIGFQGMDLFFNYDLNDVFATGRGPELQAISFGFIL